jgi:hypothetical protein
MGKTTSKAEQITTALQKLQSVKESLMHQQQ